MLVAKLNQTPGAPSEEYGCGEDVFYAVKRLITASMSKDHKTKANCRVALQKIETAVSNLQKLNKDKFCSYFIAISNYKKHCEGRKPEINGYIQGKIDVIRILKTYFAENQTVIDHIIKIVPDFEAFEE